MGRPRSLWQTTGPMTKWCVIVCWPVQSVVCTYYAWLSCLRNLMCLLVNLPDTLCPWDWLYCFSLSYRTAQTFWTPEGTVTRVTWGWNLPKGKLFFGTTTFLMEEVGSPSIITKCYHQCANTFIKTSRTCWYFEGIIIFLQNGDIQKSLVPQLLKSLHVNFISRLNSALTDIRIGH